MRKFVIVVVVLVLSACEKKEAPIEEPPAQDTASSPINIDNPESCKGCHQAVYDEWTQSMHSRAHHSKDPIYGGMRELRMQKQGEQIAGKCAKCHNSRSPLAVDEPAGLAGVSCASCHNVAEVHILPGKVGVDALVWEKGNLMRSSRDLKPGSSPVHGTGKGLDAMKDGVTLCLACHNATQTPAGAPACTTGPEYQKNASQDTCVSCHMPQIPGPAGAVGSQERHSSHQFLGPHRAWYQNDPAVLKSAAELKLAFAADGLELTVVNQSAHSLPSGFPGRMVVFKVVGKNAAGEVIWQNFESNAMAEHPSSVLNKVYHDKDGKPAPAPFAQDLVRDSRLKPSETRTISYDVPAEVVAAEASMLYFLLPSPLAATLKIADLDEAKPKRVMSVTASRE